LQLCKDAGVPAFPEVGQEHLGEKATTWVLEFVVKSPDSAKLKKDMTALEQLEYWKNVKVNYTEHNPSVTIYVEAHEWDFVKTWVYGNWEFVGGLSFLPASDHVYKLAPYEEIDELEYTRRAKKLLNLDLSKLPEYEREDKTETKRELACVAGQCEI
jgi:ribonucleoside-diphosphate reductase alpha chain